MVALPDTAIPFPSQRRVGLAGTEVVHGSAEGSLEIDQVTTWERGELAAHHDGLFCLARLLLVDKLGDPLVVVGDSDLIAVCRLANKDAELP